MVARGRGRERVVARVSGPRAVGRAGSELLPGMHMVASHLDRWWLGTRHGAIRHWHLDAYLDEFAFRRDGRDGRDGRDRRNRRNRRNSRNRRDGRARGLLFHRLMEGVASTEAVTLRELWGGMA